MKKPSEILLIEFPEKWVVRIVDNGKSTANEFELLSDADAWASGQSIRLGLKKLSSFRWGADSDRREGARTASSFFTIADLTDAELEVLMAAIRRWTEATRVDIESHLAGIAVGHAADLMAATAGMTVDDLFGALFEEFTSRSGSDL